MSILAFLFCTSVIYFATVGSADSAAAAIPAPSDQDRVNKFMADVEKSYDENLTPALGSMDKDSLDDLKNTCMDAFGSYVNYVFFSKQFLNESQTTDGDASSQNVTDDDIILLFKTVEEPFSPVYVGNQPPCLTDDGSTDTEE